VRNELGDEDGAEDDCMKKAGESFVATRGEPTDESAHSHAQVEREPWREYISSRDRPIEGADERRDHRPTIGKPATPPGHRATDPGRRAPPTPRERETRSGARHTAPKGLHHLGRATASSAEERHPSSIRAGRIGQDGERDRGGHRTKTNVPGAERVITS